MAGCRVGLLHCAAWTTQFVNLHPQPQRKHTLPLLKGRGGRAVARAMQEQQLLARQMVLQQQAASAVAAASKTQREVCPHALELKPHTLNPGSPFFRDVIGEVMSAVRAARDEYEEGRPLAPQLAASMGAHNLRG